MRASVYRIDAAGPPRWSRVALLARPGRADCSLVHAHQRPYSRRRRRWGWCFAHGVADDLCALAVLACREEFRSFMATRRRRCEGLKPSRTSPVPGPMIAGTARGEVAVPLVPLWISSSIKRPDPRDRQPTWQSGIGLGGFAGVSVLWGQSVCPSRVNVR